MHILSHNDNKFRTSQYFEIIFKLEHYAEQRLYNPGNVNRYFSKKKNEDKNANKYCIYENPFVFILKNITFLQLPEII